MTTNRTDIHAPKNFDPADYEVVDFIDNKKPEFPMIPTREAVEAYQAYVAWWQERIFTYFPNWTTGGTDHRSIFHCNHCGQHIRWVAVVKQISTGKFLAFGEICSERVNLPNRAAFSAKYIKDRAALLAAAQANQEKLGKFAQANPEVAAYLADVNDDYDSKASEFVLSLKRQLRTKFELSEAQVAALQKTIEREKEFEARKAAEREALKDAPPVETGKRTIVGTLVSYKWQDSAYGGSMKMLVQEPNGNKLWGTMPESLSNLTITRNVWNEETHETEYVNAIEIKGATIKFNATVERSGNDEHFGFFKRPTKVEVIAS